MTSAYTVVKPRIISTNTIAFAKTHYDYLKSELPITRLFEYKGKQYAVLPRRVDITRQLAALGFEAPTLLADEYPFPRPPAYDPFDHQIKTVDFLVRNRRSFCFSGMGCVDSETEYLSPTGWVKISEYKSGLVAQYDLKTKAMSFVQPEQYIKLPCEDMIRVKTRHGVDQLLSDEHRVLLRAKHTKDKTEVITAAALLRRQERHSAGHKTVRSETHIGYAASAIPTCFGYSGGSGIDLTDAELRVMVAVLSGGTSNKNSPTNTAVVRVKLPHKIKRLETLLRAAGIPFKKTPTRTEGYIRFSFTAPRKWRSYGPEFWDCTAAQLRIITEELRHWCYDGKPNIIYTYRKESADFIQFAFSAQGKTARICSASSPANSHFVYIRDTEIVGIKGISPDGVVKANVYRQRSTDGFKYCFSVPSTFLVLRRNGCVFVTGNSGKTFATLWALDYLRQKNLAKRVLIATTLSTVKSVWARSCFDVVPRDGVAVLLGSRQKRLDILKNSKAPYIITNHDGLKTLEDELAALPDLTNIVIDEANVISNAKTDIYRSVKHVADGKGLWLLTGTPCSQSPLQAWALGRLINPELMSMSQTHWRDAVCYPKNIKVAGRMISTWHPRKDAMEKVFAHLQPAIRFATEDCIDLPPVLPSYREVDLSTEQKRISDSLKKEYIYADSQTGTVVAANAAARLTKLLQVHSGAVINDDKQAVLVDYKPRFDALRDIIAESGGKVLVFATFTATVNRLVKDLNDAGIKTEKIDGSVNGTRRGEIIRRFQQTSSPEVIIAQPKSTSHGVTLTEASTVVWFTPTFSTETYLQGNARINRPGQRRSMQVIMLHAGAVERAVYDVVANNEASQAKLLHLYRELTGNSAVHLRKQSDCDIVSSVTA